MSTGANAGNQSRSDQSGGGNIVGKAPASPQVRKPQNFQGKSGQPDNQSTNRPKGTT